MEQRFTIELLEENEAINIYSLKEVGETYSEFEKFMLKFPEGCKYDRDVDVIIGWLEKIGQRGALERYFKPEGKFGDGVSAIPIVIGNKVRLYCLRITDQILILGNGGVKDAKTWQESPTLSPYVRALIEASKRIKSRVESGKIKIEGKVLSGKLNFKFDEKK